MHFTTESGISKFYIVAIVVMVAIMFNARGVLHPPPQPSYSLDPDDVQTSLFSISSGTDHASQYPVV